jgi:hypothetical protein
VSDAFQFRAGASPAEAGAEEEILDAVPVLADEPGAVPAAARAGSSELERRPAGVVLPAVQAAAVAAGGFVAGAAVVGLVHRRQRRALLPAKAARGAGRLGRGGARRSSRAGELIQIVGSRSLLVDVHLLGGADTSR